MPPEAQNLADSILKDPARVAVDPVSSTAERIAQTVYFAEKADKRRLLEHLLRDPAMARTLVFTRTKHGANRVAEGLEESGVPAAAIHGNKSQGARERALSRFKSGEIRVLVATDIAARGLDVDGVAHVVNYELPHEPETYVHRIGRTGRAGQTGAAVSFCDAEERPRLVAIERLLKRSIPARNEAPAGDFSETEAAPDRERSESRRPNSAQRTRGRGRPGRGGRQESRQEPRRGSREERAAGAPVAVAAPPRPAAKQARRKHRRAL
jgi:ATP-dependent RNA helicase RhlE